jgi:hypothetical protein
MFDGLDYSLPLIWVVWAGIKSVRETHHIYCLCSREEFAQKRCDSYTKHDQEYHEDASLDYWYEKVVLDHLVGDTMLAVARRLKKKMAGD